METAKEYTCLRYLPKIGWKLLKCLTVNKIVTKQARIFLACFVFSLNVYSQENLIINPSFEQYDSCVAGSWAMRDSLIDWFTYTSADIYSDCLFSGCCYVPNNNFGYQWPVSGSNYVGMQTCTSIASFRDYAIGKVKKPTKPGKKYCSGVYLSLIDTLRTSCDDFGIAFTDYIPIKQFQFPLLDDITPQIQNDPIANPLTDHDNWMMVKGSFIADGTERYVTLGNFKADSVSHVTLLPEPEFPLVPGGAYYFADDVFLYELKALHSRDTLVCPQNNFGLQLKSFSCFDHYLWSTGDTTASITITQPGTYYVTAGNWCGTTTDTITVSIQDTLQFQDVFPPEINLCPENFPATASVPMEISPMLSNILWSNGDTLPQTTFNQTGDYVFMANYLCGNIVEQLRINQYPSPVSELPQEQSACIGQSIILNPGNHNAYLWSNGNTTATQTVTEDGIYSVSLFSENNCQTTSQTEVTFFRQAIDVIPSDTVIYFWQLPLPLSLPDYITEVVWNTGETNLQTNAEREGLYYFTAKDAEGCEVKDSITIKLKPIDMIFPSLLNNGTTLEIKNLPPTNVFMLYDAAGRMVMQEQNYQNNKAPVLASGIYLISLNIKNQQDQWITINRKMMVRE